MLNIETKLSGDMVAGLEKFEEKIKTSVIFSGAAAMARVLYDEVKINTAKLTNSGNPREKGREPGTLDSAIYRVYSPEKSGDGFKTYRISWNHAVAPHGHLIEFGTSRAPAHPFIRPAFDHVHEAIKAGNARMAARLSEGVEGHRHVSVAEIRDL